MFIYSDSFIWQNHFQSDPCFQCQSFLLFYSKFIFIPSFPDSSFRVGKGFLFFMVFIFFFFSLSLALNSFLFFFSFFSFSLKFVWPTALFLFLFPFFRFRLQYLFKKEENKGKRAKPIACQVFDVIEHFSTILELGKASRVCLWFGVLCRCQTIPNQNSWFNLVHRLISCRFN